MCVCCIKTSSTGLQQQHSISEPALLLKVKAVKALTALVEDNSHLNPFPMPINRHLSYFRKLLLCFRAYYSTLYDSEVSNSGREAWQCSALHLFINGV